MILAAGLGTRLRPLTDTMPKALVPVDGRPMLEHVLLRLKAAGANEVVVNIHHFGQQIVDFLRANDNFGLHVHISDERERLLDTGGALLHARTFLERTPEPFLVHNVDIRSDADLAHLYEHHRRSDADATLLVSPRQTSRDLLLDPASHLSGWRNRTTGETRPADFHYDTTIHRPYAFSGIHVLSPTLFQLMDEDGWQGAFSIIDFYLAVCRRANIMGYVEENLRLVDMGKLDTLNSLRNGWH